VSALYASAVSDVAIVHDYLTQRGGAERVVLSMMRAFPEAPLYTSLYAPDRTFPEFADADIRTLPLNSWPLFRNHHRLALPLLAPAFSRLGLDARVVLCSSSGWAHGVRVTGRKIVYCHSPARWLYQGNAYIGGTGARRYVKASALKVLRRRLIQWDKQAAGSAARYLTNSSAVRDRIRRLYGIDAEVLPPPPALKPDGPRRPIEGLEEGFVLCVSRLLPYKNVDVIVEVFDRLRDQRLVVVGSGPAATAIAESAPPNVSFLGSVDDSELRWLYASCSSLVAASYEDYGLTPLEAAAFGKPSAVLRWGGFLDTVAEGETGVFFDEPKAHNVHAAVVGMLARSWDAEQLRRHAASFSEENFIGRLRTVVAEEAAQSA
jgi:glycosyltransferase involved in cell wall biosynthesis